MYIIQTFCAFSSWVSAQMRMIETGPASILLSFQGTYALPDQLIEPGANGASKPTLPPEVLETLSRLYHGAMRDLIAAIRGATEGCPQLGRLAQRLDFDSWYTAKSDDPDKDEDVADLESPDTGVFEV